MCLTTKDPAIKIAEQDIKVYKHLEYPKVKFLKRLFNPSLAYPYSSVWSKYVYKKGETQPAVTLNPVQDNYEEFRVHQGYHSHATPEKSNSLFIIPKGTKYIEGWNNGNEEIKNYVSETIVFVEKLTN